MRAKKEKRGEKPRIAAGGMFENGCSLRHPLEKNAFSKR
jgi:hypothetical protein